MASRARVRYRGEMGNRVVLGGLLVILAACGGQVDSEPRSSEAATIPPREGDQGFYIAPKPGGPEPWKPGI